MTSFMSLRTLLVVLLLGAPALAAPKKKKPPPPPPKPLTAPMPKVAEALGDTVLEALANPTRVQVFRVADSGGLRPEPSRAIAASFERGEAGKELGPADLEALRSLLYDERSYRLNQDVSRCRFLPMVSFQWQEGIDTLEALVSFSCNQVLFVLGKPGNRWVPQGTFDLKPARKKLLELARAALPQDRELQRLK